LDQGSTVTLVELPGAPSDGLNTRLDGEHGLYRELRPLFDIPRMSTFAMGAMLNRGVRRLRAGEAYVNVGVWNGFTFLSGLRGNPERLCIGIDNFSQFQNPREAFLGRFEENRGPAHHFFDMDYEEYFASRHDAPIGLYFYDGDHAYEHQLRGLQIAEPFFTDDCVVLVDDTNWPEPRRATLDFIAQSEREYELLLDVRTAEGLHPTFWNGVMVFQATGTASARAEDVAAPATERRPPADPQTIDFDARSTLVSLIVCNEEDDGPALGRALELALAQTWPAIEVVVVNTSREERVRDTLQGFEGRIVLASPQEGKSPARAGFEACTGSLAAILDPAAHIDERAVETGLALPTLSRFHLGSERQRFERIDRALGASADVGEAIPASATFVIAGKKPAIAQAMRSDRALPLFDGPIRMETLEADGAIARLEELRRMGATFAAFLWDTYNWLSLRPELQEHLGSTSRMVLENDRVRVLEFVGDDR
jgi:hypothetical protein